MTPPAPTVLGRFLVAYRERLYIVVQLLLKYGQAARGANVVSIVPGFASMYRTNALAKIKVLAPGLVIEDFNMTFEVHHKGLGRVAFDPGVRATTQDPDTLGDYTRQMRRWCLGFWQTVRRHGFWPSRFGLALSFSVFDLLLGSLFLVSIPVVLLGLGLHELVGGAFPAVGDEAAYLAGAYDPKLLLLAVVLPDYALTVLVAAVRRRPLYLVLGLGFLVLRVVDAATALYTLPLAWARRSSGRWVSPVRRPAPAGPVERRDLVDAAP